MIAYDEGRSAQPPSALLVDLAHALHISTDELLGVALVRETLSQDRPALEAPAPHRSAPPADQRAVLKLVEAMLEPRRRVTPPARAKRKAS